MHCKVIKYYKMWLSQSIYIYLPFTNISPKMTKSLTFTLSFRIKLITREAPAAEAIMTQVYTYMITSSFVCFTWIALYLLRITQNVRSAVTPTMIWPRTVTFSSSGLKPTITSGIVPGSWIPCAPSTMYWR